MISFQRMLFCFTELPEHLEGQTLQPLQINTLPGCYILLLEECEGLLCKCSFKLLHFLCNLTGLARQFWKKESTLKNYLL